jgi:toxin ParE1/3/4
MLQYRLSILAKYDLVEIARYTDERFGIEQSNLYRDRLKKRFELIADQPLLFPAVDHIREGYRRAVRGQHSIYYRLSDSHVEIMRVLGQQDHDKEL